SGMAEDIRESFLGDTKEMSLYLQRQSSHVHVCFQFNVDAALLHEVVDIPAQTSGKTELIEHRRGQKGRGREGLFQTLLTQRVALREQQVVTGRGWYPLLPDRGKDRDGRNVLGGHFMRRVWDPPPLVILLLKNVSGKPLQLLRHGSLSEIGTLNPLPFTSDSRESDMMITNDFQYRIRRAVVHLIRAKADHSMLRKHSIHFGFISHEVRPVLFFHPR